MKDNVGLLVPVVLILCGVYILLVSIGTSGEQVALFAHLAIPRGLAIVFGLLGLVGGGIVLMTALSKRHTAAAPRSLHP